MGATGVLVGGAGVPAAAAVVEEVSRPVETPDTMVDAGGVLVIVVTTTLLEKEMVVTMIGGVMGGGTTVLVTEETVPLTLGKGTTAGVVTGGRVRVVVSGGHGTSVVYVLVTRTGDGVDTLMVQGQAGRWLVLTRVDVGRARTMQLTESDGGLRGDGVGGVQVGPGGRTGTVGGEGGWSLLVL